MLLLLSKVSRMPVGRLLHCQMAYPIRRFRGLAN